MVRAFGKWDFTQVDFPVPRGPKRKKLLPGLLKKRDIVSILLVKKEFAIPKI
jgi:hypothetical protein